MKDKSGRAEAVPNELASKTLESFNVGGVSIELQVEGRSYRWDEEHGLVERRNGKNVPLAGTESEAWKELHNFLLLPPILSVAISLGTAVKHLEKQALLAAPHREASKGARGGKRAK